MSLKYASYHVYLFFLPSNYKVSIALLGIDITCSTWPTSENFGCTVDGDSWKALDSSLDTSRTSACEKLCSGQGRDGCCFLRNGLGCYWKGGAKVSSDDDDNISVECKSAGTLPQSLK
jgi:hypothetical protein